jgi:hypothetical protein
VLNWKRARSLDAYSDIENLEVSDKGRCWDYGICSYSLVAIALSAQTNSSAYHALGQPDLGQNGVNLVEGVEMFNPGRRGRGRFGKTQDALLPVSLALQGSH